MELVPRPGGAQHPWRMRAIQKCSRPESQITVQRSFRPSPLDPARARVDYFELDTDSPIALVAPVVSEAYRAHAGTAALWG